MSQYPSNPFLYSQKRRVDKRSAIHQIDPAISFGGWRCAYPPYSLMHLIDMHDANSVLVVKAEKFTLHPYCISDWARLYRIIPRFYALTVRSYYAVFANQLYNQH